MPNCVMCGLLISGYLFRILDVCCKQLVRTVMEDLKYRMLIKKKLKKNIRWNWSSVDEMRAIY